LCTTVKGFLSPWRRFFGLGLHADSSIRENAGRERGLCLAGFTATHLLRPGVDINTIRAWLGYVSIDTTNIYAESDLAMKAKALAMCEAPSRRNGKRWRDNPDLLAFLAQL
jgi:hypothetical protein